MPLSPGTKLGQYEVIEAIGAGGMGEVYRARDTKLGRDVAIKVLPEEFARDKERLDRFEREARLLAQVNHANIATLYGLEEHDGQTFIVMELVEGETLAERIAKGRIPVDEAIPLFTQIAEGLEAAHEKGIVHRDLKPANVKIGPDGKPKILDFGLAKAFVAEDGTATDSSQSPTLTKGTALGVIMGTPSYMSPEQARGKVVDKRTDIWAFGACLYEALSGRRPFQGNDSAEILASVLKDDPDWGSIPRECPDALRWALERCLAKDRAERLHDIADARIELRRARSGSGHPVGVPPSGVEEGRHRGWREAALATSLIAAGVLAVLLWQSSSTPEAARTTNHFELSVGPDSRMLRSVARPLALTSDGRRLVYTALRDNRNQLFLRSLDSFETVAIPGGEDAVFPFLSPDDEWVGFFANGELWKVPLAGGSPTSLARAPFPFGGSWGADDQIVFSPLYTSGLWSVPAGGGTAEQLTAPDSAQNRYGHVWPQHLPDGQNLVFTIWAGDPADGGLAVLPLQTGAWRVAHRGVMGGYFSQSGHLLYSSSFRAVLASTFDTSSMSVGTFSTPVLSDTQSAPMAAAFSLALSRAGTMAYLAETSDMPAFQAAHRNGAVLAVEMELPGLPLWPRLSPDGTKVVAVTNEMGGQRRDSRGGLWVFDLERGTSTPLLGDFPQGAVPGWAIWSPDGTTITFGSNRAGSWDIYRVPADGSGTAEPQVVAPYDQWPVSWSPDGSTLVYVALSLETGVDIWTLEQDSEPAPFLATSGNEGGASVSPDGRWLVYVSDQSGRREVYLQPFPAGGERVQVSTRGGTEARWSREGSELYFRRGDLLLAVSIDTSGGLEVGQPEVLFEAAFEMSNPYNTMANYDVGLEGNRFLMVANSSTTEIRVVQNWFKELERLVPTND